LGDRDACTTKKGVFSAMHLRLYRRILAAALILGALVASLAVPVAASASSCYSTTIGNYAYVSCSDGSYGYANRIGNYTYYNYSSPYGYTGYAYSNQIGNYTYYTYYP
jgi:hypothetical protein